MKHSHKSFLFALGILILHFQVISQNFSLKSHVLDSENGYPLPFASIMILNHNKGTTTDIGGYFSMVLSEMHQNDTLIISYMGYKSKKICICDLNPEGIKLDQMLFQLDSFKFISERKTKTVVLNSFRTRNCIIPYSNRVTEDEYSWLPYRPHEPSIEAMLFKPEQSEHINALLKEIWIYTRSWSIPSYFRLRLFQPGEKKIPHIDIITENIIVEVTQREELVKINLQEFDLFLTEDGILVGFEIMIIPENKHDVVLHDIEEFVTLYSPYLQYHPVNDDATYWFYSSGIWKENQLELSSSGKIEKYIPAISLIIER